MPQVTTEHVLLGLITEDTSSKNGFLNSGLTAEKARAAVQSLSGKRKPISTTDSIPFSREVRKTFEAATNVGSGCGHAKAGGNAFKNHICLLHGLLVLLQECKRAAVSYISPEHILLALLNQPDASGKRVLDRWVESSHCFGHDALNPWLVLLHDL